MRSLRVYLLVLGSLFCLLNLNFKVEGCAYSPAFFEDYATLFQSNLAHDPIFQRYYYDFKNNRPRYEIDGVIAKTQTDTNLQEWQRYFDGKASMEMLANLVYKMTTEELEALCLRITKDPDQALASGPIYRSEYLPAFKYLTYAKKCEPYVIVSSPWDYEQEIKQRRQPLAMKQLIDNGLVEYQQARSTFLKARYGYQIVRLANFADQAEAAIGYYDQLIAKLGEPSIVSAWALRHKIGALHKVGREAESLLLASLLFDQNVKMMNEAFIDFNIPADPIWEECLRLAGQKHRQATLWMLRGLQEQRITIEPLQQMYELEPKSPRLEVLLVRQVNKIEREYTLSALLFKTNDKSLLAEKVIALKYIRELQQFVTKVDKRAVSQPALWYATAAYLSILERQPAKAVAYLNQAQALKPQSADIINQLHFLRNLNQVLVSPVMNAALEDECYQSLRWLESEPIAPSNLENVRDSFYAVLAQKYLLAHDNAKGYYTLSKAELRADELLEFKLNPKEIDKLIAFLTKKAKSRFETLITANPKYTLDDLYSIKGTILLRQQKYPEAQVNFKRISPSFWNKLKKDWDDGEWGQIRTSFAKNYYNPRTGLYKYPRGGMQHYTKLEFVQQVNQLQELARRQPQQADRYYFQIANGFFHSPFWAYQENIKGSRIFQNYDLVQFGSFDDFYFQEWNSFGTVNYRKIALAFYLKTIQVTKDKELAAQCYLLAQACKTEFSHYHKFEEPGKDHNYYFKILKQQYSETNFYKNVIKECATLKNFVAGGSN